MAACLANDASCSGGWYKNSQGYIWTHRTATISTVADRLGFFVFVRHLHYATINIRDHGHSHLAQLLVEVSFLDDQVGSGTIL